MMEVRTTSRSSFTATQHSPFSLQPEEERFLNESLPSEFTVDAQLSSFSNKNYKIYANSNFWIFRIGNIISCQLSSPEERAILDWALQERFSLIEVRALDEAKGYLLTRFLSGESCHAVDFQSPVRLQEALTLLYRLHTHQSAPIHLLFDPLERYKVTVQVAQLQEIFFSDQLQSVGNQLQEFWEQIPTSRFQKVPCHNDPSPENFFLQDGRLYLHDWELARLNDPMWDLAHFSVIANIDPALLLANYPTNDALAAEKIALFQPFIYFNTVVWAALEIQKPNSTLPTNVVRELYEAFLEKIDLSIKSHLFLTAIQKLIEGI